MTLAKEDAQENIYMGSAGMYTNVQGIKNRMSQYDSDGDYIDPTTGMAGLLVTEENSESRKRIISIPESSRESGRFEMGLRNKNIVKVREYNKEMKLEAAVNRAVEECIERDILRDILEKHRREVVNNV